MKTTGKGIVIREQTVGESDRLVTLLTDDFGLIKAFVRRAKRISSAEVSGTTAFAMFGLSWEDEQEKRAEEAAFRREQGLAQVAPDAPPAAVAPAAPAPPASVSEAA